MQGFMVNKTKRLLKRASTRDALRRQREQEEEQQLENGTQRRISSLEHLTMQCRFPSLSSLVNFSLTTNGIIPSPSPQPDGDKQDQVPEMKRPLHKTHSFSATSIGLQIGLPSPSRVNGNPNQVCVQVPLDVIVDPNNHGVGDDTSNRLSTNKLPSLGEGSRVSQPPQRTFKPLQRAKSCYITLLYPSMQEEELENESVNTNEQRKSENPIKNQNTQPSVTDTQSVPLTQEGAVEIPGKSNKVTNPEKTETTPQNLNDSVHPNDASKSETQLPRQDSKRDTMLSKQPSGILKQDSSSQLAQLRSRMKSLSRRSLRDYKKPFDSILQRDINGNDEDDEYDIELGRYIDVFRRPMSLSPALKEVSLENAPNETNDECNAPANQDEADSSLPCHVDSNKESVSQETITVDLQGSQQAPNDAPCSKSEIEISSDTKCLERKLSTDLNQVGNLEKTEILANEETTPEIEAESKPQPCNTVSSGDSKRRGSKQLKKSHTKHSTKGAKDTTENAKESNKRRSSLTKTVQNGKAFLSTLPPFSFRQLFQKKQFSTIPILPPIGSSKKYQIQEHKENSGKDDCKQRQQKVKSFYLPSQPDKPMTPGTFQRRNRRVSVVSTKSNVSLSHKNHNDEPSKLMEPSGCVSTKTMTTMADLRNHFHFGPFKRFDRDKNKQSRHIMEIAPHVNVSRASKISRHHKSPKEEAITSNGIETNHKVDARETDKLIEQ